MSGARFGRGSCGSIITAILLLSLSPPAVGETERAVEPRFAALKLASVPLPGTADEVVVHSGQALEVFLSPSDFPDAFIRFAQSGEDAIFSMNLDESALRGEAVPRRVRWPRLGGNALEVTAATESIPLEPPAGGAAPSAEALADPEAGLEWYIRPEEGDEGALRATVQAVRLVSPSGRTLLAWIAPIRETPCRRAVPRGEPRCRHPGISDAVTSLAVQPAGRWVVVAGGDMRPRIDLWHGQPLELTRRLAFPPWMGPPIRAEFTPDGSSLLVADAEGTIHVFDAETGGGHRTVATRARAYALLDAGRLVAASDSEGGLTLWRTGDGTISSRIGRHAHGPSPLLAASGDGLRVAAVSYDEQRPSIVVWELESEQVVGRIAGAGRGFVDLALDAEGEHLLATRAGQGLLRYQVGGEARLVPWGGAPGRRCNGRLALNPDRSLLACVTDESEVAVFDTARGRLLQTLTAGDYEGSLGALAFTPDSERLLATAGGEMLEWTLSDAGGNSP